MILPSLDSLNEDPSHVERSETSRRYINEEAVILHGKTVRCCPAVSMTVISMKCVVMLNKVKHLAEISL
jgi:hypothetical protein